MHRRPWCTRVVAAGLVSSLVLAMVAMGGVGNPAHAQAGSGAHGTASASAVVLEVTPGVGSLNLGVATGVALAKVTNEVAQAQAESLDFGLVGLLFVALGVLHSEDIPAPLIVDNRKGDASRSEVDYPIANDTLGGGTKEAAATTTPSARAAATVATSVGPLLKVGAGRAEATADLEAAGAARTGRASVSADLDIGGLVQLSGMRWEAHHRSGRDPESGASFEIAHAAIGGVPVPTDSLAALGGLVNAALAPTGASVQLPTVEHATGGTDIVRVTPLRVLLKDTPVGDAVLTPFKDLTREQRSELFDRASAAYGPAGPALLAADVLLSIASGQGFLSTEIGGAEAWSADLVQQDLLGAIPSVSPAPSGSTPVGTGSAPSVTPTAGAEARSGSGQAATDETTRHCESVHLRRPRGCSSGAMLPLGLAGAAGAVGVGVADLRRRRGRRRGSSSPGATGIDPRATRRVIGSYGPLLGAGLAFAVLAVVVSVPRTVVAERDAPTVPDVSPAATTATAGGDGGTAAAPSGDAGRSPATPAARAAVQGQTTACRDRAKQVPHDPYSPPCYAFTGGNGGATSIGVTDDTITVTVRQVEAGSATDIFVALAGQSIEDTSDTVATTLQTLADYFSDHFQFYGRRLKIQLFQGRGNGLNELLGGGKEEAAADAEQAEELKPFADLSGNTLPYADGLARHQVVNVGAPYPSRAWFVARRPYAWSLFPDGTNVADAATSAIVGRYPPGSRAEFAGGDLATRPRRFAVVAPENPEYQESVNVLLGLLDKHGIDVVVNSKYKLDLASMPNQASNIIAQLKDAGVTSIACFCDPAMLAFGMTPKANEQHYEPEWITSGLVFVDQDVVAQAIDAKQWAHAFGTAYNAESERIGASFPYAAYKSERPSDEPAVGVEELYYQMYLLAIGVQMAGPDLTPESFEAGLFAYPPSFGPRGTWDFGPGDYTPTNDYRELWWDPNRISTQNDRPGTWVQLNGGKRYSPSRPPSGRAPFFSEG